MLPPASLLRYAYLAYASSPAGERRLYRDLRRRPAATIVEIGVGRLVRARRLIEVARRYAQGAEIAYTGVDLFEDRTSPAAPGLPLREAYRQLKRWTPRVRLIPGDPLTALANFANRLTGTDLLIVSDDVDAASLAEAWRFVPRMLHAGSQVYVARPDERGRPGLLAPLSAAELLQRSQSAAPLRRAA